MTTLTEWGAAIAARRNELGLTQRELAAKAKTTQQYLALIERGGVEPRLGLRLRIAEALDTTPELLFPYPAIPA
jgi:transcriptional regulator with XRE-family HTH domain